MAVKVQYIHLEVQDIQNVCHINCSYMRIKIIEFLCFKMRPLFIRNIMRTYEKVILENLISLLAIQTLHFMHNLILWIQFGKKGL
jgi:hypothetical protein